MTSLAATSTEAGQKQGVRGCTARRAERKVRHIMGTRLIKAHGLAHRPKIPGQDSPARTSRAGSSAKGDQLLIHGSNDGTGGVRRLGFCLRDAPDCTAVASSGSARILLREAVQAPRDRSRGREPPRDTDGAHTRTGGKSYRGAHLLCRRLRVLVALGACVDERRVVRNNHMGYEAKASSRGKMSSNRAS